MNIDYIDDIVIIDELPAGHANDIILQLSVYGFRKNGTEDRWLAHSDKPAELIMNLFDYLSTKGHNYSISDSASTVIDYHQNNLEFHYKDMQDIEFTIENKKLWMLQTRTGKRNGRAALKIALSFLNDGIITNNDVIDKPSFGEISDEFIDFIHNLPIIGHNVEFDLKLVQSQMKKYPQSEYLLLE